MPASRPPIRRTREMSLAPPLGYLYGRNPVLEALRAGRRARRVFLATGGRGANLSEIGDAAERAGVPVQSVARDRLDDLVGDTHHQGVAAEVGPFPYTALDDLLAEIQTAGESPLLLVLDSLQDPQNFGTLLRTALASGVHGVVIPEHRAVGVTPAVSKASAGAVEHLKVAQVVNLARALGTLNEHGVWVYGLDSSGETPFWSVDWAGPSAVVVGAEGTGLGRLVKEWCDGILNIPMAPGSVDSLNAATAGSLVLYEAFRRRLHGSPT